MFSPGMPKLTLNRVFALSLFGLLAGLALLFWLVFSGLQAALLRSAEQSRNNNSAVIGQSVTDYLGQAPAAAASFESLLQAGLTKPSDLESLRDGLMSVLLRNNDISEATFTYARRSGYDAQGISIIDPTTVGQVDLFRARLEPGFVHRNTWYQGGHFLSTQTHLYLDGHEGPAKAPAEVPSPASHLTFITPARRAFYGQLLWTDLHWFAVDADVPELKRRVEVSVQKAIEAPPGQFAGVLRIGLFKDAIDRAIAMPPAVDIATHTIFLCDNQGRLIARSGSSHYVLDDDDVRVDPAGAPPQMLDALRQPILSTVNDANPLVSGTFATGGATYLCTFRSLPQTQQWIVGVAVPRRAYLADLLKIRAQVVWGSLALAAAIAFFGGIVLHGVSVAHSIIVREAARMNDFVLDPSKNSSRLSDINRVLSSLERAKTAMRSMGKYVPLDLVRRLYHRGEEPRLGAEATELSVLFTDIRGFTEFAETVDADTVAVRLGAYLHVMASVVQDGKGTIDKFIGDSVMAFWNAPEAVPGHSILACRAALACRDALAALYGSPEWGGRAGFRHPFRPAPLHGLRRALWIARALQLHRHWRWHQPRLPPREPQQALRHRDYRQRRHPGRRGAGFSVSAPRPCCRQRKDAKPGYIRVDRRVGRTRSRIRGRVRAGPRCVVRGGFCASAGARRKPGGRRPERVSGGAVPAVYRGAAGGGVGWSLRVRDQIRPHLRAGPILQFRTLFCLCWHPHYRSQPVSSIP